MRAAVLYLRSKGKKVTGLLGHSKGGTGVILYAAAYDDIPRVVNVAGRFDNMQGKRYWSEMSGCDLYRPATVLCPLCSHCQYTAEERYYQVTTISLVQSAK